MRTGTYFCFLSSQPYIPVKFPLLLYAAKLMSVVLGGTPSSKLFMNVREKQSLCYYCAARHDTPKNVQKVPTTRFTL